MNQISVRRQVGDIQVTVMIVQDDPDRRVVAPGNPVVRYSMDQDWVSLADSASRAAADLAGRINVPFVLPKAEPA